MAGKLLTAEQTERRRIARELHDDLGQGLALLSVELDLLQQKSPVESGELKARVAHASARIKQLSTSIHELSHRLHPMKLEQLGLVATLRALCKELGESHGLEIQFLHDAIPSSIPPDIAICLYRVAQEGLQNIVKHSQRVMSASSCTSLMVRFACKSTTTELVSIRIRRRRKRVWG